MADTFASRYPALNRRNFILMTGAGLMGAAGCGGSSGGGGNPVSDGSGFVDADGFTYLSDPDPTRLVDITGIADRPQLPNIVRAGVAQIPTDGSVTVASLDAAQVTLTGANLSALGLTPGQILLGQTDTPLLRRIVNISSDGGSGLVLQTEDALIDDAFDQFEFRIAQALAPGDGRSVSTGRSRAATLPSISFPIPLNYSSVDLYSRGAARVTSEGNINLRMTVYASARKNKASGVWESLYFLVKLDGDATFTLKSEVKQESPVSGLHVLNIASLKKLKAIVDAASHLRIGPRLDLGVSFKGTFLPGMEIVSRVKLSAMSGFSYTDTNGFNLINRTPRISANLVKRKPSNAFGALTVHTAATAKLSLDILGLAGPYLDTELPYLDVEYIRESIPAPPFGDLRVHATGGFKGDVGVSNTFTKALSYKQEDVFNVKKDIFNTVFYDDGTVFTVTKP